MCLILKKLSKKLQPFHEAVPVINEILLSKKGNDIRVLEHLLSYAELQLEKEITGNGYRERECGQVVNYWHPDIAIFHIINSRIAGIYSANNSISVSVRDNKRYPFLEKSLCLLNPWLVHLGSDALNRVDRISNDQIIYLWQELYTTEQRIADVTINRDQFDVAEIHCQRCLAYSKKYIVQGEDKTLATLAALRTIIDLRQRQGDYSGAVEFCEEAYNLVVEAYDPVHRNVQEAAGMLINLLIDKDDLYNAFRFAEQTYSNLKDHNNKIDQESEDVAFGAYNLADVILQQKGDLIKCEKLAREALRIRDQLHDHNDRNIARSCDLLARILQSQSNYGDETKELLERCLSIFIRVEGDRGNTAAGNNHIGTFYYALAGTQSTVETKRKQLLLAKSYFEEAYRIQSKINSPNHPNSVVGTSRLSDVLSELSRL
jgi:hypothetical protein